MKQLNMEQVISLGRMVAADNGIRCTEQAIQKHMTENPALPMLLQNEDAQLWVDRYYIAYSRNDEIPVHYVYITPKHVSEEMQDLPQRIQAAKNVKQKALLKNIRKQLKHSIKQGQQCFIRRDYLKRLKSSSGGLQY